MNLPGRRVRGEAEEAVDSADRTIRSLGSEDLDLGPAARLLERAGKAMASRQYPEARDLAGKAEETARLLDRVHSAATKAIAKLREERAAMLKLGMDTREIDDALTSSQVWMTKHVERDGDPEFPAYAKAGEVALEGLKWAADRIPAFKRAVVAVSTARQRIQDEIEMNTFIDPSSFRNFIMKPATDVLAEAVSKLQANDLAAAEELAQWTVASVHQFHRDYASCLEAYREVEAILIALRSEGAPVARIEEYRGMAKSGILRGKFEEAEQVCAKATEIGVTDRERHRGVLLDERKAVEALEQVAEWGFDTTGPAGKLEEGRLALKAGKHDEARRLFAEARADALRLRENHRLIAERLGKLKETVTRVRGEDPGTADDVEGLLQQTEEALAAGNYAACEENLQVATLMLGKRSPAVPEASGGPGAERLAESDGILDVEGLLNAELSRSGFPAAIDVCAECGGPLKGEELLCAKCRSAKGA